MNEFLAKLIEELARSKGPDQRAELLARIAGIRARLRDFDGARKAIDDLRAIYGDGRSGVVTVSIMLAEGLLHQFESFRRQALDKFTRAQVLSIGMGYEAGIALSSAWKANYHFEFEEYEQMVQALRLAVLHTQSTNYDAATRLGITLFNAFAITGNNTAAQYWFMQAREAAAKNKDRSSIEALLYNRAAFLITRARAENCFTPIALDHLKALRMDISSAKNFQDLSNIGTLPEHLRLWDARLKILECEYGLAESILREIRGEERFSNHNFSKSFIDLEMAYCQANSGNLVEALSGFPELGGQAFDGLDVDEQLVAAWIKQRLAELDTRFGDPVQAKQLTDSAASSYRTMMDSLSGKLSEFIR